ncbi:MAG TPA: mechanosensitive ion channel domain-containing protein, partial [Marinobacter sp.]|nr:mechanosensitive ion channel domain-containing protein [Marinobacter sp.]
TKSKAARAQTIVPIARNTLLAVIIIVAIFVALSTLGVDVTPLLAGAGIIGLAVGFGAQTLVQDLITGLFIVVEDSMSVGDFVEINGFMGTVEGFNLRTVRMRDLEGVVHHITFSKISSIHNMSREFGIALIKIRIPPELPIDDAILIMTETADELRTLPDMRWLIWSPLEMQGIHAFEEGCPVLRMRMRTKPECQWQVSRAFNLLLKRRLEERFLNVAAPRMSVHMEAERGARPPASDRLAPDGV